MKTVKYHRNPTKAEIKFGYGAIHYRSFPAGECINKSTGMLKKWLIANGVRYYL